VSTQKRKLPAGSTPSSSKKQKTMQVGDYEKQLLDAISQPAMSSVAQDVDDMYKRLEKVARVYAVQFSRGIRAQLDQAEDFLASLDNAEIESDEGY
jgi:hypothetical protein